jgi:hypothetical protein
LGFVRHTQALKKDVAHRAYFSAAFNGSFSVAVGLWRLLWSCLTWNG